MNNTIYSTAPITTQRLLTLLKEKNDPIMKSKDVSTDDYFKKFEVTLSEITNYSKIIWKQFVALRADYTSGNISSVKYKSLLSPFNTLLTANNKVVIPGFDTKLMADELKKWGY